MNGIDLWDIAKLTTGDRVKYLDVNDGRFKSSIIADVAQEGTSTIINLEDDKTIIIDVS